MRTAKLALALLAFAVASPALAEEFKVIANNDVAVEALTRTQLSDIFLKRSTSLPGGARAVPVDLGEDSRAFEAFCLTIHGKPGSLIRAFWKRVALTGRDTPPAVRGSDEEVISFVRSTRGAIGYVSAGANVSGVKVLRVGN